MSALKITLPENCNEVEAKALQDKFLSSKKTGVECDGKAVDRVNTLFAQMLMAIHYECQQRGGQLSLKNPSEKFELAFLSIGAQEKLQEWKGE